MRIRVLTVSALVAAAAALPAQAAPLQPAGAPCSLEAATAGSGATGVLSGGPMSLAGGRPFTLRCSVQVGESPLHAAPDAAVAAGGSSAVGAAVVGPTPVAFQGTGPTTVCTEVVTEDGLHAYLDAPSGAWLPDPNRTRCGTSTVAADPAHTGELEHAVAGWISISVTGNAPVVTTVGYLADPSMFACQQSPWVPNQPFTVTCVAQPSAPFQFYCAVLHANAGSYSATGAMRTRMDCDGDAVPEAETSLATGVGPASQQSQTATSNVALTAFTCTVDDGSGNAPRARTEGGCGDPGAPRR